MKINYYNCIYVRKTLILAELKKEQSPVLCEFYAKKEWNEGEASGEASGMGLTGCQVTFWHENEKKWDQFARNNDKKMK